MSEPKAEYEVINCCTGEVKSEDEVNKKPELENDAYELGKTLYEFGYDPCTFISDYLEFIKQGYRDAEEEES